MWKGPYLHQAIKWRMAGAIRHDVYDYKERHECQHVNGLQQLLVRGLLDRLIDRDLDPFYRWLGTAGMTTTAQPALVQSAIPQMPQAEICNAAAARVACPGHNGKAAPRQHSRRAPRARKRRPCPCRARPARHCPPPPPSAASRKTRLAMGGGLRRSSSRRGAGRSTLRCGGG